MIDIKKAQNEFLKYTEKYDLNNENIKRKQGHSIRVMKLTNQIAKSLNLSKEEVDLATLIGLLHDIARFEQYTIYKTFVDLDSFDHANYGVEILNKDLRKYIDIDKYDNIIKIAIKNHNKLEIEDGLSEKELLFSKIIRDADKIDIIFEGIGMFWIGEEEKIENSIISDNVLKQFQEKFLIKRKKNIKVEYVDEIISLIAFIFDLNFIESFNILNKNDYINKIINRFNFKDMETKCKIEEVRSIANNYIKFKLNEDI